jgi:hypothetical protein
MTIKSMSIVLLLMTVLTRYYCVHPRAIRSRVCSPCHSTTRQVPTIPISRRMSHLHADEREASTFELKGERP